MSSLLFRLKNGGSFAALGLATGLALGFSSTAVQALSLQDALISAYTSNPTLLAQRASLRATDEGANQARAGWRPTVSLSSNYTWGERQQQSALGFSGTSLGAGFRSETYTESVTGNIVVTQPLFRGFQTRNATKAADARVRSGRTSLWAIEQQTLLEAVTTYADIVRDAATVEINRNNVQVLARQLEAANDRFRVGEITRTDVAQSEARYSGAQSNLKRGEALLAESNAAFEVAVGFAPENLEPLPPLPALPSSLNEAIDKALANNPSLLGAMENESAAKFDVAQLKGNLLPTVQLQGSLSASEDTNRDQSQSTSTSLVGQISLPLYQAGNTYSRIREAKHLHSQRRMLVAQGKRQAVEAATTAWETLLAARATIVSDREQVRANEIAFEGVQQEAQVGSRTTLDVLDAEQELLDSRVGLARSKRDEYVRAYQLLVAIGDLTAENLNLPVDVYDPSKNYNAVRNKWAGMGVYEDGVGFPETVSRVETKPHNYNPFAAEGESQNKDESGEDVPVESSENTSSEPIADTRRRNYNPFP